MRIGVDLARLAPGIAGGICPLLRGVWQALFRLYPEHEYHVFCTSENRELLTAPPGVRPVTLPFDTYFEELDRLAQGQALDVVFRGYPIYARMSFPLSRQVFLVPDLQHERHADFFRPDVLRGRRMGFTQAQSAAGAIGTLSEYARRTLREHELTACRDIFLMSPALTEGGDDRQDLTAEEQASLPSRRERSADYFIYPANLWPHKNHRRALQAFALFLQRARTPMRFLFTGHPDGWRRLRRAFAGLPAEHLGFVSARVLRQLMRKARALVFFSLYEGFGMPLLEAFAAGTPVICSNTTSLPEVGGDAVLSCDPTDVAAMSDLMVRITTDDEVRGQLVARGRERLTAFSWEQSAHHLFAALQRVAQRSANIETLRHEPRPLVSIVTPSYNQGRFLRRTIDSVLQQTYPHIEYVVIDGGSTDESVAVLKSYGCRLSWVSERDQGQTHAINKGFTRLRAGSIRAYLNSDDVLLPGAVQTVVGHFVRHPDWELVYGRAHYIDEEDRLLGDYKTAEHDFGRLMEECCICQPAAFWRTRIAQRVGPFNERLHYVMDYDYWIRIDRAGGIIEHVPEVLACARLHAAAKTVSARCQIYRELFRTCLEEGGYVSESHFHGFWHHLCQERAGGWPRRLSWLPGFQRRMAYLHHKWYRSGGSLTAFCRAAGRAWMRQLGRRLRRRLGLGHTSGSTPTCHIP